VHQKKYYVIMDAEKKIAKKDEQKHFDEDCGNTLIECEYNCKDKVMKKDLKQHNVEYLKEHFEKLKLLLLDRSLKITLNQLKR